MDKTIIAKVFDPNVTRMLRECYDFVTLGFRFLDRKSAFRPCGTGVSRTSAVRFFKRRFLSAFVNRPKSGSFECGDSPPWGPGVNELGTGVGIWGLSPVGGSVWMGQNLVRNVGTGPVGAWGK